MKTKDLAKLLSLAVASHRAGNEEDSHDMFGLFMQEVAAEEQAAADELLSKMEQVISLAFSDFDSDLPVSEEANAESDDSQDDHDFFNAEATASTRSFFDEVEELTAADADEDEVVADVDDSTDYRAEIAANLAALRGQKVA